MKNRAALFLLSSAVALVPGSAAYAQATRTWVSGVGDDVNPCSRTAPCKTFAGAISKTAAGGEIDALDPGGFGGVTITKAITIDGRGTLASVLVSGTNAIIVNIPSGAAGGGIVILRNLSINGIGAGVDGIRFFGGTALHVENVLVDRFTGKGLNFNPGANAELFVSDSTFSHNGQGIAVAPSAGTSRASIENTRLVDNSGAGLRAEGNSVVTAKNSVASGNNNGFIAIGNTGPAFLELQNCASSHNTANGIGAGFSGGGTPNAFVSITNCIVTGNTTGLFADASGTVRSWGDNKVADNGTDGMPASTLPLR
jgi:hypothetical protein